MITKEEYQNWLDNPVTREFHNDLRKGLASQPLQALEEPPPGISLERHIGTIQGYVECTQAHLEWEPEEIEEGEGE